MSQRSEARRHKSEGPNSEQLEALVRNEVQLRLDQSLEAFIRSHVQTVDEALKEFRRAPKFSGDDVVFLVWTLGFTAGAHLERDGERGERIFGRCRQLIEQLQPQGGNGS